MIGSISIGLILDSKHITRRIRGFLGWAILLIMVFVVHIWAYFYQRQYTRESLPPNSNDKVDIFDHGYAGRILVYMFMGLLDAMWQTTIYWIIGAMSNDPARLAHLAGIYKSIQSAGSAGSWRADAVKTPYMAMFISTWALLGAGLVFALPVLYFRVKNHTEISDEALLSQMPSSSSKYYHPYFSPAEVEYLSEKQRGKQSATAEDKVRQTACAFLETVGARIGFPRKTVASALSLYHRFHLFFPRKDFPYHDVALAALYVSAKEHDTLKKPRELLAVSYAVRFPELAAKSKHPGGEIDLDTMDPTIVEADRLRLLAIERLILETICFNFTARMPFPYVIKLGKEFRGIPQHSDIYDDELNVGLAASKTLVKLGWRICMDSYRTLLPLIYPPHTMALGSIFVASLLLSFEQPPSQIANGEVSNQHIVELLSGRTTSDWQQRFHTGPQDLEDFAHTTLDLLIQYTQNPSANTSPSTPSSPSANLPNKDLRGQAAGQQPQYPYKADQLIRLKIAMRETEHPPRWRQPLGNSDPSALYNSEKIGQNEGTVRFLFFPPGFPGSDVV
ncbi:hypothetical protein D9619_006929 [Psilocybe cf. subviscida]|uniref:Cyclin-like domain-containing protein n=1 Tax=Psilocybe cf. subviscida TaxID=2480587 RepID=A0A8H5B1D7_9AGAR|nr:hypothetical protein D9619_006929 [Psilocybe cf. subviscida]